MMNNIVYINGVPYAGVIKIVQTFCIPHPDSDERYKLMVSECIKSIQITFYDGHMEEYSPYADRIEYDNKIF